MEDFLKFKKMLTPLVIQALFWIGVVLLVIGGIGGIVSGVGADYGGGRQVLSGLLTLFLGPVLWRIWCELLIVFFSINDTLTEIKNKMRDTIA